MDTNNKTVEELNELLYEKMEREQAEYKQSLVGVNSWKFRIIWIVNLE